MATQRNRIHPSGLATLLMLALALLVAGCGGNLLPFTTNSNEANFQRTGGLTLVLQWACPPGTPTPSCAGPSGQQLTMGILATRSRIGLGVGDESFIPESNNRMLVELPGYSDLQNATTLLTQPGQLVIFASSQPLALGTSIAGQLCQAKCQSNQIRFTGAEIDTSSVAASTDPGSHQPVVTFAFNDTARQQFADYTRANIGGFLNIAVDGVVLESAAIMSEIDGNGEITGLASEQQARDLAAMLVSGPLPLTMQVVAASQVPPGASATPGA